jgi:hypothetical protein
MIVKGSKVGLLIRTDTQYYGARQAFKVYGAKRGHVYGPWSVNGIGPTWSCGGMAASRTKAPDL